MQDEIGNHAHQGKDMTPPTEDEKDRGDGVANLSDERSQRRVLLSRFWWVILSASLLLAEMQVALDTTITADLQPAIVNALGEASKLPWINVTYSLVNGASCLLW